MFKYLKQIFSKKQVIVKTQKQYKTQKQLLQEYAESFLLDAQIPLENVFIHPASNGKKNGACLISFKSKKLKDLNNKYPYSNDIKSYVKYLYLPEVVDYYTCHVWLHEIGHYIFNHLELDNDDILDEYEAEMYALNMMKKFPYQELFQSWMSKDSIDISHRIHNLEISILTDNTKNYIKTYEDSLTEKTPFEIQEKIKNYIS